jgi:hypothetical protein
MSPIGSFRSFKIHARVQTSPAASLSAVTARGCHTSRLVGSVRARRVDAIPSSLPRRHTVVVDSSGRSRESCSSRPAVPPLRGTRWCVAARSQRVSCQCRPCTATSRVGDRVRTPRGSSACSRTSQRPHFDRALTRSSPLPHLSSHVRLVGGSLQASRSEEAATTQSIVP